TIVGPSVIRQRAPLSLMDALRTVPGIQTADEDPFGLNLNIGLRGLPPRRSSRTLLLAAGMPILLGPYGEPSMHSGPPVEALEVIEVLKGSAQITEGPQTSGGVINFITRSPPTNGRLLEATAGGGGAGYRNFHAAAGIGRAGRAVSLDLAYRTGDGVRREHAHTIHKAMMETHLPGDRDRPLRRAAPRR